MSKRQWGDGEDNEAYWAARSVEPKPKPVTPTEPNALNQAAIELREQALRVKAESSTLAAADAAAAAARSAELRGE